MFFPPNIRFLKPTFSSNCVQRDDKNCILVYESFWGVLRRSNQFPQNGFEVDTFEASTAQEINQLLGIPAVVRTTNKNDMLVAFSFMNCCLIWCAEARAGTVFCKPPPPLTKPTRIFHGVVIFNYTSCLSKTMMMLFLICECFQSFYAVFFFFFDTLNRLAEKPPAVLLLSLSAVCCVESVTQCFISLQQKRLLVL